MEWYFLMVFLFKGIHVFFLETKTYKCSKHENSPLIYILSFAIQWRTVNFVFFYFFFLFR